MNPETFQDPQKFLWPYVYAKEAQKQLEEKQIEVEENFAVMQAVLGWLIDNPWVFLLFIQREIHRLDVPINGVAQAEIERCKRECEAHLKQQKDDLEKQKGEELEQQKQRFESQLADKEKLLNQTVLSIWNNLKDKLVCPAKQVMVNQYGDLLFEGLFDPDKKSITHNPPDEIGKESMLNYLKREVFNAEGINVSQLNNCPPSQPIMQEYDQQETIQQPAAKKVVNKRQSGN